MARSKRAPTSERHKTTEAANSKGPRPLRASPIKTKVTPKSMSAYIGSRLHVLAEVEPSCGRILLAGAGSPAPLSVPPHSSAQAAYLPLSTGGALGSGSSSVTSMSFVVPDSLTLVIATGGLHAVDDGDERGILRRRASGPERAPRALCERLLELDGPGDAAVLALRCSPTGRSEGVLFTSRSPHDVESLLSSDRKAPAPRATA
jgi:Stage II sporulation protein E (SpoIIE)